MPRPDPIRRKARELVILMRTCPHWKSVDAVEATLRLIEHQGYMRGERLARQQAMVEAIASEVTQAEAA